MADQGILGGDSVCLITPLYKTNLDGIEIRRIQVSRNLHPGIPLIFVYPKQLKIENIRRTFKGAHFVSFSEFFFESKNNYNLLMLNELFYENFQSFKYLVILQLDSFLIKNISPIIERDYDYVGSPFFPRAQVSRTPKNELVFAASKTIRCFSRNQYLHIGNGGLSIRKIESFRQILKTMKSSKYSKSIFAMSNRKITEDIAFSYFLRNFGYLIPKISEARKIFCDSTPLNQILPSELYGFHGLGRRFADYEDFLLRRLERQL